jgi:glycosyltransferase involved in cell wall biosynthesis
MKDLSIIFPCYNESENLLSLFNELEDIKKKNINLNIEFVIVNNGSTDITSNIIRNNFQKKHYKIINIKKNIGYGNGVIKGVLTATGKVIAWTHADMQCSVHDVIKLYKKYEIKLLKTNCVVKGLRKKRPLFDSIFSFFMSIFCSCIFFQKLKDVNAQPKVFNKKFIKFLKKSPKDFSLDLYFLYIANKNNFKIFTYPVYFNNRSAGSSKGGGSFFGKLKLTFKTLIYIINLKINEYNSASN